MSILNGLVQGKRAYIIADMAWCNADGTLADIRSKFIIGRAFPFLIAFTGNANPWTLAYKIEAADPKNGRQLIAMLPDALREMQQEATIPLDAGLMVAIWDKRAGRPFIYLIANTRNQWPGAVAPFEPFWAEHVIGGQLSADQALGRPVDLRDPVSFDPLRDAGDMVEAQRKHHRFEHLGVPAHRIGGGVEVGILTRRGVRVERVRDWPDEVGEMISLI